MGSSQEHIQSLPQRAACYSFEKSRGCFCYAYVFVDTITYQNYFRQYKKSFITAPYFCLFFVLISETALTSCNFDP